MHTWAQAHTHKKNIALWIRVPSVTLVFDTFISAVFATNPEILDPLWYTLWVSHKLPERDSKFVQSSPNKITTCPISSLGVSGSLIFHSSNLAINPVWFIVLGVSWKYLQINKNGKLRTLDKAVQKSNRLSLQILNDLHLVSRWVLSQRLWLATRVFRT